MHSDIYQQMSGLFNLPVNVTQYICYTIQLVQELQGISEQSSMTSSLKAPHWPIQTPSAPINWSMVKFTL